MRKVCFLKSSIFKAKRQEKCLQEASLEAKIPDPILVNDLLATVWNPKFYL